MSKEYLELQSVLENISDPIVNATISDIESKNNRIYFRLNGHLFSTFGSYVYHENYPLFDHPVTDLIARRRNTPEGIAEEEASSERINEEIDMFYKHKLSLYKLIFARAIDTLLKKGNDAFLEYVEYYFDISENGDNCKPIIKQLEKNTTNDPGKNSR